MNASRDEDEDWDDEDLDLEDDSDEATVPCPSCDREMFEDSPRCPHCGHFVSAEDDAGPRRPRWVVVTALICIGVAVWWVFTAF